jgi:hypothetical protein
MASTQETGDLVVRVLVHQVAYLISIVICNSFIHEIFWGCVVILVAFDPSDIGSYGGLGNLVVNCL